jgi:hypothetical protein
MPGEVRIENLGDLLRPPGPATFGVFFRQGMVRDVVAAADRPSQIDAKRRWPDGSLKHAVMTVALPELASREQVLLKLQAAPARAIAGPAMPWKQIRLKLPSVGVRFRIHGGPRMTSTLKGAVAQRADKVWLRGGLVVEHLLRDVPVDDDKKADPDIEVRYHVRHYPGTGATRVAVIVENTKWTAPGNIPYDVDIVIDGKQVFSRTDAGSWPKLKFIGHPKGARWIKRFWIGPDLGNIHVRYQVACLVETGLLPRYDVAVKVPEKALRRLAGAWQNSSRGILQNGLLTAYFPTTGGRAEIGPLPSWAAQYILSQDRRAWAVTRGIGDLSGGVGIHLRDPKTGLPVSLDDYPGFSLNTRGTKMKMPIRDKTATTWVTETRSHFSPDSAHQGSFAYLPYLVTGDYFYFEEMAFWANFNLLRIHQSNREQNAGLILANQTRGVAWALRNLAHAAALAPDNSYARPYFEQKLSNNLKRFQKRINSPGKSPLGVFAVHHAYTRGWSDDWRYRYFSMAPWQHNFLVWSVSHVVDLGYPSAMPFLSYLAQFPIGLVTNPEQITPHAGSEYFLLAAKRVKGKRVWARSWKELDDLSYQAPSPQRRGRPTSTGGGYGLILRAALAAAARAGLPNARAAFDWAVAVQEPQLKKHFERDPKWALTPGRR